MYKYKIKTKKRKTGQTEKKISDKLNMKKKGNNGRKKAAER